MILFVMFTAIAAVNSAPQTFVSSGPGGSSFVANGFNLRSGTSFSGDTYCGNILCPKNSTGCIVNVDTSNDRKEVKTERICLNEAGEIVYKNTTISENLYPNSDQHVHINTNGQNNYLLESRIGEDGQVYQTMTKLSPEEARRLQEQVAENVRKSIQMAFERAFPPGFPFHNTPGFGQGVGAPAMGTGTRFGGGLENLGEMIQNDVQRSIQESFKQAFPPGFPFV